MKISNNISNYKIMMKINNNNYNKINLKIIVVKIF